VNLSSERITWEDRGDRRGRSHERKAYGVVVPWWSGHRRWAPRGDIRLWLPFNEKPPVDRWRPVPNSWPASFFNRRRMGLIEEWKRGSADV
jgi:hypothetical protein